VDLNIDVSIRERILDLPDEIENLRKVDESTIRLSILDSTAVANFLFSIWKALNLNFGEEYKGDRAY